jgi:ADP-ribose pyrophosphatase
VPTIRLTSDSTTYQDPLGRKRTWESAQRPTRPKGSEVDGVGIVAVLEKPGGPEILLQKQFRPPVNKVCIEVPAGLVDEGESPEVCAVRELKEETGYVGEVLKDGFGISPIMFNGTTPSLCTGRTTGSTD